jgi:multiple sugar transport system permease protein
MSVLLLDKTAAQQAAAVKAKNYRLQRILTEVACLALAAVLIVWTLAPIYNMVMVALQSHNDVFTNDIWPKQPSLNSFWIVITEGYWYLEYFWHQFGNSLYIGVMTVFFTLFIASSVSFSVMRMRLRNGWLLTNAALLTDIIPAGSYRIPGW